MGLWSTWRGTITKNLKAAQEKSSDRYTRLTPARLRFLSVIILAERTVIKVAIILPAEMRVCNPAGTSGVIASVAKSVRLVSRLACARRLRLTRERSGTLYVGVRAPKVLSSMFDGMFFLYHNKHQ